MEYQTLLVEKKAGYTIITLNRPDKLNALNALLLLELAEAAGSVRNDDSTHALIVTGSGTKAFAAGADIAELHEQNAETGAEFARRGQQIFSNIEHIGKPVIAAVNGFALGGGCELALACHVRFCSMNAKFGQPEVNLGIIPGYGGTQRLTRLVGAAKAAELILSGNIIDAQTAASIGLVNSIHTSEELLPFAEKFAQTVAGKAPIAIRAALSAILAAGQTAADAGMETEARHFGVVCGTEDFAEGTAAFLEKRAAVFTGK
ncbi:enoyl-CoA hydratase-related protein [Ignavibacteria bacterium]|nr:enoyl-CoA hydratase/isomerase family protein [Bacteroidota bacterium]MCZ2132820.1 enoyl-CoA hydratase/isomerase family protein [Bacteroidota bacterium]